MNNIYIETAHDAVRWPGPLHGDTYNVSFRQRWQDLFKETLIDGEMWPSKQVQYDVIAD
jgi:hypothetical protein